MSRIEDREERRVIRVPKTHSVRMAWALRARVEAGGGLCGYLGHVFSPASARMLHDKSRLRRRRCRQVPCSGGGFSEFLSSREISLGKTKSCKADPCRFFRKEPGNTRGSHHRFNITRFSCRCIEEPYDHIYYLLGWRHRLPVASGNLTDGDKETAEMVQDWARTFNEIDRAVWPPNFEHVEHTLLRYNQPADTNCNCIACRSHTYTMTTMFVPRECRGYR